ncbi:MAG TPA: patatin-like phospholipase family protein [Solirubrobacteraceae bacterium]|nr:patatin-like phospholipase family protein [Solirubrobacteraceae bacterium]
MHPTGKPSTAFVLSGGASLGAIQVGMLRALYEREIVPDVIVGTSAGAMNGAFIASRPPTIATTDALASVWRGLRRCQIFPVSPLTGLLGFIGTRDHMVPASGLRKLIEGHIEHERLEDLPIPLHVVAVDVISGEELRLSRGPIVDAVLASAAIPGVVSPVRWGDRRLMDGGVANNTPISHAVDLGARRIYVLPTGYACALPRPPRGALAVALHAISLLTQRRLIDDIARHRGDARLIVLPPPCPLSVQPIDFAHADELVDRALADARRFLDTGIAKGPPIRLRDQRRPATTGGRPSDATHDPIPTRTQPTRLRGSA